MGTMWTKEQQKVIDTRNCNILVSAAAGSGKTAVLVERIISMITDPTDPVDVDRLLIVTFTRAAAGEMRERIRQAIENKLALDEDNEHLQRQSTLLHHAQITTIDSFCSYVVRNYFHLIDLDPSYRIGEEGEMKLMQADAAAQVLEAAYEEKDPDFIRFVECFSTGKTDEGIEELIKRLYSFSVSYPYPEEWLESCKKAYDISGPEDLEKAEWMKLVREDVEKSLLEARYLSDLALEEALGEEGPYFYQDALASDRSFLDALLEADSFGAQQELFAGMSFARLSSKKDKMVSEEKKILVKNLRQQIKDILQELKEYYFLMKPEKMAEYLMLTAKPVHVLIDLTLEFSRIFAEKKKEKNILDFSDQEHFALNILVEHTAEGDKRTKAAEELSAGFREIMIDEYQDSNFVQEKLLQAVSKIDEGVHNIFMVGDVKQSIYRFRLARPDLFMEKFKTYSTTGGDCIRIDLHKNFRSKKEVLEGANFIFYQIMGEALGNVEYDQAAALYPGASYPDYKPEPTELLLVETDDPKWEELEAGETAQELEARAVAAKLREVVGKSQVLDKASGGYRPAEYKDCVILLRTLSGWSETFKRVLNAQGIPASVTTKTGYFSASEVVNVLNYLRILDNPLQDIPFTGVLHNLPGGCSLKELAGIKCLGREAGVENIYGALQAAEQAGNEKAIRFLKTYREIRNMVTYASMHELLWKVYEETGIMDAIQAGPAGEQQKANLIMLLDKAKAYESTSYKGLFNFIRYIENLQKYQVDFGEADVLTENEDTVRIMSIHKSKGLEFPIVFVSGMGKNFNLQDARARLVMHPDLGIGADWIDAELRTRTPLILKKAVQRQIQLESLGEELRILYVALTRAREKLILTGCVSKLEKKLTSLEALKVQEEEKISYGRLVKARSYLDWLLDALCRHRSMDAIYLDYGFYPNNFSSQYDAPAEFQITLQSPVELVIDEAETRTREMFKKQEILQFDPEKTWDEAIEKQVAENFAYRYQKENEKPVPGKVTVSEIKRRQMEDPDSRQVYEEPFVPCVPDFIEKKEETLTGAARGTAYHRVFQVLDFSRIDSFEAVKEQLLDLEKKGTIDEETRKAIYINHIVKFAKTPLGRRMREANERGDLYKEQPFVISIPACQLDPELSPEEEILVQGIIDAYFQEKDGIVLMDYKTDKVEDASGQDLLRKYKIQLEYYAEALERITAKKVKEIYIYSVGLDRELVVQ